MKNIVLLSILMLIACSSNPSQDEIGKKLKSAWTNYLYERVNFDSSKVKYRVEDVTFYDDNRGYYDCQFQVRMILPNGKDTIGKQFGYISKEFKVLQRNY